MFLFVGLFPCVYDSWDFYPFVLSVCNLLMLPFHEPSSAAFLAEARFPVGGWSMATLARLRNPGKGHGHSSSKTLCKASVIVPVSEGLWGRNFLWITHVSSMSQAFVSQRVPLHCCGHLNPDKCPGPCSCIQWRWARDSLRNLSSWQIFHWFCWLPQAALISQPILLLSESFISISLPTGEICIKMSFHCLSHVNILGYFLQRDFMYLFTKVTVVQVVTWVHHGHGCCFIYIEGYNSASV